MANLIQEYIELVSNYTDAPLNSITASAYWLISATLGYWLNILDTPSEHGTRCNLFVLIIGPAGLTRKSTVMDYAEFVYREAWKRFYEKTGMDVNIDDKFIEEYTIEGICDTVEEGIKNGIDDFVILIDEFGVWLSRVDSTHLLGSKGLLSKLYYSKGYKQSLSRRGGKKGTRRIPDGLYWTLIGGMQDPELYLTETDIRQGFLRRFLLVPITEKDLRKYKPPLSHERRMLKDKLISFSEKLTKRMVELYNFSGGFNPIDTYCSQAVEENINNYDMNTYEEIRKVYSTNSIIARYMATSWEHVLKLTALTAIADDDAKPIMLAGNPSFYISKPEHFDIANSWFDYLKNRIYSTIETISVNMQTPTLPQIDNVANKVLGVISRAGGSMTTGELLKSLATTKKQIGDYLVTLAEQGKLIPVLDIAKQHGTVIRLFINKDEAEKYVSNKTIMSPNAEIKILSPKLFETIWLRS